MSLRCIIVDDEPNAVQLLEVFIGQATGWHLLAKCYDALEAMAFLKENTVDLIFLDINLPHLSGMELAALLPKQTAIVFTTAYSEYAAESYGFETIDYLLKPITLKRFFSSLKKIESYFEKKPLVKDPVLPAQEEFFFVKSGKMFRKILLKDILYFEGQKEYARLVTASEQMLIYRRLKDIEEQVAGSFVRVHHSYIVNIAQVDKIADKLIYIKNPNHAGLKKMSEFSQIPISEKFRENFMSIIRQRSL